MPDHPALRTENVMDSTPPPLPPEQTEPPARQHSTPGAPRYAVLSSARKQRTSRSWAVPILAAVALLLVVAAVLAPRSDTDESPTAVSPPPTATPTAPPPTATPTPSLDFPELGALWVDEDDVEPSSPLATPTPDPYADDFDDSLAAEPSLERPVPSRPQPRPTLTLAECLALSWNTSLSPSAPGQVLVEIEVYNRCGRDLEAMDVWFTVRGIKDGATVQMVRGHLFDPLPDGDRETATIGLPGSPDFYDDIQVEAIP